RTVCPPARGTGKADLRGWGGYGAPRLFPLPPDGRSKRAGLTPLPTCAVRLLERHSPAPTANLPPPSYRPRRSWLRLPFSSLSSLSTMVGARHAVRLPISHACCLMPIAFFSGSRILQQLFSSVEDFTLLCRFFFESALAVG